MFKLQTKKNYGFIPDTSVSIHLNCRRILGDTPTIEYFSQLINKSFHDLTTGGSFPPAAASLLGLGHKYIIVPKKSLKSNDIDETTKRFIRDLYLKVHFAEDDDEEDTISPLRVNSEWMPNDIPDEVRKRTIKFVDEVYRHFPSRKGKSNITKFQATILESIRSNENIMVIQADKNLGPVGVDVKQYIRWALDEHLLDSTTYVQVSEDDAQEAAGKLFTEIYKWTRKYDSVESLTSDSQKYIRYHIQKNYFDPFGYFYLNVKIHKEKLGTRPVCSDCASLVHPLGKWLDMVLQEFVTTQHTYFKDSFTLKRELNELVLPPNASLFTCDAIAMYPSIVIDDCIDRISTYLLTILLKKDCEAIIDAMKIVTYNNRMRFGDLIFHQIRGVAMGMSPAPTIANLYVAIYELSNILPLLNKYLFFYKRFIDDGFGIWLHDADPKIDTNNWTNFESILNGSGLKWTFVKPCKKVAYLDMTIQIENGLIVTSLYAKPMALYQYIPPASCHPPGVLTGLVLGQVLRIFQLCSNEQVANKELRLFYKRLINRGYKHKGLLPLFEKGIINATSYMATSQDARDARKKAKIGKLDERVFFHLPFHPQNPTSTFVQRLWRDYIFSPSGEKTLIELKNHFGARIPTKRLIVAYHRNPNIANLLSYRILSKRTGLKASSFIGTNL